MMMEVWGVKLHAFKNLTGEALKLAIPIVFGQLGMVFMGFFDLLMLGQVGTAEVAATGISNALFFLFFMFALGVTFSISPLVAIACGSGRPWKSWLIVKAALKVALILSLILMGIYRFVLYYFPLLGQSESVEKLAYTYLDIVSWSVIPMLFFTVGKHYLDGLGRTVPASVITLFALILNIILNKILIFGMWQIPAMGLEGAAWATNIVRGLMLVALCIYIFKDKSTLTYKKVLKKRKFKGRYFKKIWIMGIPIGLQFFFEVAAFSFAAIMAGWLGEKAQAAHNIALNLASVTYMGATGVSAAGAVMIGNAFGAKNREKMLLVGKVILCIILGYMLLCAISFVVFRDAFAGVFSNNPEVIGITSGLLILAAFFQLSDGLQNAGMGLLRGMKDVKVPSIIAFISYWIIGMPVSYFLGFHFGLGINGVWIGFIVGLTTAGVLIVRRFFGMLKVVDFESGRE